MAAALVGLVYGICAGVIWAAYHEFGGSQSLLDYTPLVAADPTPLKLLPKDRTQDEAAALRGPAGQGAGTPALADAARPASPTNGMRRATARGPGAEQASGIDPSAAAEGADGAQPGAEPGLAADDPVPEEWSVAAAPETRFEVHAAASRAAAPAVSDEPPQSAPAAALPPRPALKPLDVIPTVMAAVTPAAPAAPETARRRANSPPRPSLKPVVMPSKARPDPTREQGTRTAAATAQTLPEALRAFWTNLKILLASAPASSSDRWGVRPGAPARRGDTGGDDDGRTDHAGTGSTGGNGGGGTSASGSGGGASSGGGSTSGSSGGSSAGGSGGGSSASSSGGGSSASSGGSGSSASSGGNGGRGRGNGGRGGRGDDDDDGGRGGGRGGDDDDDDD